VADADCWQPLSCVLTVSIYIYNGNQFGWHNKIINWSIGFDFKQYVIFSWSSNRWFKHGGTNSYHRLRYRALY